MRKIDAHLGKFIMCDVAVAILVVMMFVSLFEGHIFTYFFIVLVAFIIGIVGFYQKIMLIANVLRK